MMTRDNKNRWKRIKARNRKYSEGNPNIKKKSFWCCLWKIFKY